MNPFKCGDSVYVRFDDDDEWQLATYIGEKLGTNYHIVWRHNPCGFYTYLKIKQNHD